MGGSDMAVHVIVQNRGRPGLLAGALGCVFGVLGIFSLGLVFVPLAALCSFVGFLRGIFGGSASGIGTSLLGAVLCVIGFATTPSLWAVTAAGILASRPQAYSSSGNSIGRPIPETVNAHVDALTRKLMGSSTEANAQLGKFPPIEQRYRTITGMMHAGLAHQQSIYGPGQPMVARSQIAVAINQAAVEAEQLHSNMQTAQSNVGSKLEPLIRNAINTTQHCQSVVTDGGANSSPANRDQQSTCLKFLEAAEKFKQSIEALGRAFDQVERVWIEERRKQAGIIQAANIASR